MPLNQHALVEAVLALGAGGEAGMVGDQHQRGTVAEEAGSYPAVEPPAEQERDLQW